MRNRLLLLLACVVLLGPVLAAAQPAEQPVFRYVAQWAVPPAQWAQFADWQEKTVRPVLERFLADGTLVDWGGYTIAVHDPEGFTHGGWFAAPSIAALVKVRDELLKLPPNPAAATRHEDWLLRTLIYRGRKGSGSGHLWVSTFVVQPGRGGDWLAAWERYFKPIYDELLANGTLSIYEVTVEQVHLRDPNLRFVAAVAPGIEGIDKLLSSLRAAMAANPGTGAAIALSTVPGTHRDTFAHVSAWAHR
jgi:hypothetical protein